MVIYSPIYYFALFSETPLTPTTVAGVMRSSASVCVRLSVRTITQKRMSVQTCYSNDLRCPTSVMTLWLKSQRSKSQVTKCENISGDRVVGVSFALRRVPHRKSRQHPSS